MKISTCLHKMQAILEATNVPKDNENRNQLQLTAIQFKFTFGPAFGLHARCFDSHFKIGFVPKRDFGAILIREFEVQLSYLLLELGAYFSHEFRKGSVNGHGHASNVVLMVNLKRIWQSEQNIVTLHFSDLYANECQVIVTIVTAIHIFVVLGILISSW